MKKKSLIASLVFNMTLIASMIVMIVFLFGNSQVCGASIGSLYATSDVRGSVSATYSRVNRFSGELISTNEMTTNDGDKTILFDSSKETSVGLLNPEEEIICLSAVTDLVVTYSFMASNTFYAGLTVADNEDTQTKNIDFYYSIDGGEYEKFDIDKVKYLKMEEGKTTIVSIKIHIVNTACDASMTGEINWALSVDSLGYDAQQESVVEAQ